MSEDTRSQRQRMLSGDWYVTDDELSALTGRAQQLTDRYAEVWKIDRIAAHDVPPGKRPRRGKPRAGRS